MEQSVLPIATALKKFAFFLFRWRRLCYERAVCMRHACRGSRGGDETVFAPQINKISHYQSVRDEWAAISLAQRHEYFPSWLHVLKATSDEGRSCGSSSEDDHSFLRDQSVREKTVQTSKTEERNYMHILEDFSRRLESMENSLKLLTQLPSQVEKES